MRPDYRANGGQATLFPLAPSIVLDIEQQIKRDERDTEVPRCFRHLKSLGLTAVSSSYSEGIRPDDDSPIVVANGCMRGRVSPKRRREIEQLERDYRKSAHAIEAQTRLLEERQRIWEDSKRPNTVRQLNVERLPADALAFYRSFHWEPVDEWGIYLDVGKLIQHAQNLAATFHGKLHVFDFGTVLNCVVFEVFNHEFFHHIVECAATSAEILWASAGVNRPLYLDYRHGRSNGIPGMSVDDPPLEESLANAYAYNAFSFLGRVQADFNVFLAKQYQAVMAANWWRYPPGYRSADKYIGGNYLQGAAHLLAMILADEHTDAASLLMLAQNVLIHGNSAYTSKPEIPTYLFGALKDIEEFNKYVPAPVETYTRLYSPLDTSAIGQFLAEQAKKEREAKQAAREAKATKA